jgi:hypothetical protein
LNCVASKRINIIINPLPRPNFDVSVSTGQGSSVVIDENANTGEVCVDLDPNNPATVTRITLRAADGRRTGEFFIDNDAFPISTGVAIVDLGNYADPTKTVHNHTIRYTFTNSSGCTYFREKILVIHQNPVVEYTTIGFI